MTSIRTAAVAALVAAASLTAVAAPSLAAPRGDQRDGAGMHDQRWQQNNRMPFQRMLDFAPGNGRFQLVDLSCGAKVAGRMETRLDRMSERLDLTADQQALFDTFKATLLTAQTNFSDTCATMRPASADAATDPISLLENSLKVQQARIDTLSTVLPDLRAFYDSLSDAQKAKLMPRHMAEGNGPRQGQHPGPKGQNKGPGRDGMNAPTPPAMDAPAEPPAPADQDG